MENKMKHFLLLAAIALLSACQNTNISSSLGEDNSSSSVLIEEDPNKTDPIYDGSDVEVSRVVTNDFRSYIEVENKPFLFTGAQIRVDAFMNCDNFTYEQIKPLFREASKLGVTCVQIPIEWAKIETSQDQFDFTYIHKMLSYANEYDLKVEFLWYGTNMCGDTHSFTVPDYILKDGKTYPKFDASRTGEYWNYYGIMWFLDFDNENLIARESNAVNKMMDYIYQWDSTHGGKKPVIGIQVLNEPDIFVRWRIYQQEVLSRKTQQIMSEEEGYEKIKNSLNALGNTIKNSKYKVYTRVNFASSTASDYNGVANGIFNGSEVKNAPQFAQDIFSLQGIDIVGDDSYTSSVKNIKGITCMYGKNMPGNFSHIAENDGSYGNSASLILASVSLYGGYSLYDLITSPFFVANNSANIDQGIMTFADNDYSSFIYKNHYEQTQSILNGLKKAGNLLFDVTNDDFACFNIKSDTASKNIEQEISTSKVLFNFKSESGAIGYAISSENEIGVYFTSDATLQINNANISKIESGYYQYDTFIKEKDIEKTNILECKKDTFYKITYTSLSPLVSNTYDYIGS
ncbi:MAG: DUF4978 domain-containing protein [Erysipelotrichaceae bacterium]|nr:DUF4978 domain-containing protein [Erysipelotrichaceae bacterium]